jgi:hypothetical protein
MFHVVDKSCEHPLVDRGHAPLHLLGAHAGEVPDHGDDRDVDFRENIGGCPEDDNRAQNEDEERDDDERIRPVESDSNDPHISAW